MTEKEKPAGFWVNGAGILLVLVLLDAVKLIFCLNLWLAWMETAASWFGWPTWGAWVAYFGVLLALAGILAWVMTKG